MEAQDGGVSAQVSGELHRHPTTEYQVPASKSYHQSWPCLEQIETSANARTPRTSWQRFGCPKMFGNCLSSVSSICGNISAVTRTTFDTPMANKPAPAMWALPKAKLPQKKRSQQYPSNLTSPMQKYKSNNTALQHLRPHTKSHKLPLAPAADQIDAKCGRRI